MGRGQANGADTRSCLGGQMAKTPRLAIGRYCVEQFSRRSYGQLPSDLGVKGGGGGGYIIYFLNRCLIWKGGVFWELLWFRNRRGGELGFNITMVFCSEIMFVDDSFILFYFIFLGFGGGGREGKVRVIFEVR